MIHDRLSELLRLGAAMVLMASANASGAETSPMPDPERAWEYRDFGPVEAWLERHEGPASNGVEMLRGRAWLARRAGASERALELIDQAINRAPGRADLRVDRAQFHSDLLEEAGPFRSLRIARNIRDELELAVSVGPRDVDALAALASFHQRAPGIAGGNQHYAEALMQRLEQLSPGRVHLLEAMRLAREERYEEAAAKISRAIDTAERIRPKWWVRKARWLLALERREQAADCLEKALEEAPSFGPALYELGRLAAQGQADARRGAAALRRYLDLPRWPGDPDHALARLELGRIEMRLERPAEARDAFRRALELDPDLDQARQALKRLSTAE